MSNSYGASPRRDHRYTSKMCKTAGSSRARSQDPARQRLDVVVVDPLAVVRAGLGMLIGDEPDMRVLAEAASVDECLGAVRRARRSRPIVLGAGAPRRARFTRG